MVNTIHQKYLEAEIMSADPVKLVHMLYRGAEEATGAARRSLAAGDIRERSRQIVRAWEILQELARALDHEKGGDMSTRLAALYTYMQTRLIEANQLQTDEPLAEVERLLSTLGEAWFSAIPVAPPVQESAPLSFAY